MIFSSTRHLNERAAFNTNALIKKAGLKPSPLHAPILRFNARAKGITKLVKMQAKNLKFLLKAYGLFKGLRRGEA